MNELRIKPQAVKCAYVHQLTHGKTESSPLSLGSACFVFVF